MKKLLLTFFIGIIVAVTACGPTNQENREKEIMDSIRKADSLAMVAVKDSIIADSAVKHIDSITNCQKNCSKKNCPKTK